MLITTQNLTIPPLHLTPPQKNTSEAKSSCYWGLLLTSKRCDVSLIEEIHSQSTEFRQFRAAVQLTAEIRIFKIICLKALKQYNSESVSHHLSWPFQ